MIIALNRSHPAAAELEDLSQALRCLSRKDRQSIPACLGPAINLSEILHGQGSVTFKIQPGHATSEQAIEAYQYIRRAYPGILDLLCHAASRGAMTVSVEVGTLRPGDTLGYSYHDLLRIMPRILAIFRGTVTPA